jgi:hypothetical protein
MGIPAPLQLLSMLLDQPLNPPNLRGLEATAALKANGAQPELRGIVVSFNVNMRRLISISRVEEETVGTDPQDRRHLLSRDSSPNQT